MARRQPIEWIYEDDTALPAGGVNSSAHDMALWLLFQLGDGTVGSSTLAAAKAMQETHTAQTPIRGAHAADKWATVAGSGEDRLRYRSYAMGWFIHDYRGHTVLSHSGGIDGFRSRIAFLPDDGFGVIALANSDEDSVPLAAVQIAIDRALGVGERDWSHRFLQSAKQQEAQAQARVQAAMPPASCIPRLRFP